MSNPQPGPGPLRDDFDSTCWSLVLAAKGRDDRRAAEALESLCRTYWYPIYAYVRRSGHSSEDAHDLTQGFFVGVVGEGFLDTVSPEKGKFRAYLITCCRHYLVGQHRRKKARKHGGGLTWEPLEKAECDRRFLAEPWHDMTPERLYERRYALTLLEQALARLDRELDPDGANPLFRRLRPSLTGQDAAEPYARIAEDLGLTEGAVKVQAHRLRKRYGKILREEIGRTVAEPSMIDEEIRDLFEALAIP